MNLEGIEWISGFNLGDILFFVTFEFNMKKLKAVCYIAILKLIVCEMCWPWVRFFGGRMRETSQAVVIAWKSPSFYLND